MHFFNEDNPLVIILNTIGSLVILNLLFLACCVPVITIGDAFSALYFALIHRRRDSSSSYYRDFFRAMRMNFKQSTLTWLLCLALILILYADYRFFAPGGQSPNTVLFYFFIVLGGLIFFTAEYVFPVIACFDNKLTVLWSNSFTFAAKNPGWTLLLALLFIAPPAFSILDRPLWPLYAAVWFFIGFSLTAYAASYIFLKIFRPYLPKSADEKAEEELQHGDEI
jgi:uncharacterized membrane protein YesL